MKPLTSLVMAVLLGPSVGASPSRKEFVIEAIEESEEITGIHETATVRPFCQPLLPARAKWQPNQPFRAS